MYQIPIKCIVSDCGNTLENTGLSVDYHPFPVNDEDLLAIWLMKCGGEEDIDPSTSFVCSKHFSNDDYEDSIEAHSFSLRPTAYPTRNLCDFRNWLDDNDQSQEDECVDILDEVFNDPCKVIVVPNFNDLSGPSEPHVSNKITEVPSATEKKPIKKPKAEQVNQSRGFCEIVTCKARVNFGEAGCHGIPRIPEMAKLWAEATFLNLNNSKRNRLICRRHFTTSDYVQPTAPDKPPRLRRGAVPSQNLPENPAVVKLAKAKLKVDLIERKKEYRTSSLEKLFSDVPALAEAYEEYKKEMRKMGAVDPIPVPVLRRRGELLGPGEPVVSHIPYVKPKKKKIRTPDEEKLISTNRLQLGLRKRLQSRQLKRRMPLRHVPIHPWLVIRKVKFQGNKSQPALSTDRIGDTSEGNFEDHSYVGTTALPPSPEHSSASTLQATVPTPSIGLLPGLFESLANDLTRLPEFDARIKVRDMMNRFRADFKRQSHDIRATLMDIHRVERKLSFMKLHLANAIAAEFENLYGPLPSG